MNDIFPDHTFYNNPDYLYGFKNNRHLADKTTKSYINIISSNLRNGAKILDVGSGNGRFTIPLAAKLPNIQIDSLDIAEQMLDSLNQRKHEMGLSNINTICSDFQTFSTQSRYQMMLFSESIHLFSDKLACLKKAQSLLLNTGVIAIRSPLVEDLTSGDMYLYFPEALTIDQKRHLSYSELVQVCEQSHLRVLKRYKITESVDLPREDYQTIFEDKIYSTLRLIPENIYNNRLLKLKAKIRNLKKVSHSIDMSLILLCHNSQKS